MEAEKKKSKKVEEERSIEELFEELNRVVGKLEGGDISLEDSFSCYEAGIKLVKRCGEKIDKVEKQIQVLNENDVEE